jgi:hypothetical protein
MTSLKFDMLFSVIAVNWTLLLHNQSSCVCVCVFNFGLSQIEIILECA